MCWTPPDPSCPPPFPQASQPPEYALSSLMLNELSVHIPPLALRVFVRAHWAEIAKLAHSIHEGSAP